MPSTGLPTPEQLQATIDRLLQTAERCYRLARGIIDRKAIEALVRLAEECEERAEELQEQTEEPGGRDNAARITPSFGQDSRSSPWPGTGHNARAGLGSGARQVPA